MTKEIEARTSRLLALAAFFGMVAILFGQHLYTDESIALVFGKDFRAAGTYETACMTSRIVCVFYKPIVWMTAAISAVAGFDHYWMFRLVSFSWALLGLFLIDRVWRRFGVSPLVRSFLLAMIVLWMQRTSAGLISVRGEMWYFGASAYSVYALSRVEEAPGHWFSSVAVLLLVFTVHPNAALGFIPLLMAPFAAWKTMRSRLRPWSAAGYAVEIGAAAAACAWTLTYNFDSFADLWRNFRLIAGMDNHQMGLRGELLRYRWFYMQSRIVFWTLMAAIAAAAAGLFSRRREIRRVALAALLILMGMAVQGAKYTVYIASPLPALAVSAGWGLESLRSKFRPRAAFGFLAAAAVFFIGSVYWKSMRDFRSNTLAQWLLHNPSVRRDRALLAGIIGNDTVHALPALFPYVRDAHFVAYWKQDDLSLTPWRDLARFKIDPVFSSDFEVERCRFLYDGISYVLSENVPKKSR